MGEVYRARDTRLGRDVALKVLPEEFSGDPERLRRFEQEAKSASALNHPNIVTVFDIGREGSTSYLAMELVEGASLRDSIESRPMAAKRLLSIAAQAADGLAAAHEKGIVHRDLKPENLMVDRAGRVKILDFGLAKLLPSPSGSAEDATVSLAERTSEGTILGTVGYMSPEQASGKAVDFHSDQFSFGAIVYEMATGRRAFRGATPVETLSSVIRDDPAPVREIAPLVPVPLVWVLDRCLAKKPEDRYGSTRDLARDLANLRDGASLVSSSERSAAPSARGGSRIPWMIAAAAAALLLGAGAFYTGSRAARRPVPSFEQLTFRRGRILSARFAPGGDSVVYGAAWDGKPFEIFSRRGSGTESRSLLAATELLSVSRTGEMAVSVNRRPLGGFVYTGTLARADLSGGAPREILEGVFEADWTPDGRDLVATRATPKGFVLELPIGKPLFSTSGWIGNLRVSPDGKLVAFIHHPVAGDDRGEIDVIDGAGKVRVLSSGWTSAQGLAWRPDGREVWFTGANTGTVRSVCAVTLGGVVRVVDRMAGSLVLQDISPSGRVLLCRTELPVSLFVSSLGSGRDVNVTWLDASIVRDISADGKSVVFTEAGEGGGPNCSVFLRRVAEPFAVRLGEGWAEGMSPDGRFVLAVVPTKPTSLVIQPVGAGQIRKLEHPGISDEVWAAWLPDGRRVVFAGRKTSGGAHGVFVQDVDGGPAAQVVAEGPVFGQIESPGALLSPDGRWIAAPDSSGRITLYGLDGKSSRSVASSLPGDVPVGWGGDSADLFVADPGLPTRVARISLAQGRRTPFKEISPSDPAGVEAVGPIALARDGAAYAYSCFSYLSTLYIADGLR